MTLNRRVLMLALFVLLPSPLLAADPGPVSFPMLGLGIGQTLRLNAVATDGGAGCQAILGFADLNGNAVGPGPIQLDLTAGQAAFLNFPSSLAITRLGQRMELQPVVSFPALSPAGAAPATDCTFGAELFGPATGFSRVFVDPGPISLPDSPPPTMP